MQFSKKYVRILGLSALVLSSTVYAAPKVVEQYRYYEVEGQTPRAIRQSMNQQRRKHVKGGYDAYVSWFLRWRFSYDDDFSGCKITTASTRVKVKYTLPRWVDLEQSPAATVARWQAYYDALLEHEHGHRDWGVSAANTIEESLKAMPYERDCLVLRAKAQRLASKILADHLRQEKRYDRVTRHGATQGAVFP